MRLIGCLILWSLFLPLASRAKENPEQKHNELLRKMRTTKSSREKIHLYEELYDVYMEFDRNRAFKCLEELTVLAEKIHSVEGMGKQRN